MLKTIKIKAPYKHLFYLVVTVVLTLGLSISFQSLLAQWDPPGGTPPLNNVPKPINEGTDDQSKSGDLDLLNGFSVNVDTLLVDALNNRVGIGTDIPSASLHIATGSDAALATVESGYLILGQIGGASIVIDDNEIMARNDTTPSPLYLQAEGGNTYLFNTSVGRSGSQYQEIGYNVGFTATNDTYTYRVTDTAASIRLGENGGDITFRTAPSGTTGATLTLTERMRIDQGGNVGIGAANPGGKFVVDAGPGVLPDFNVESDGDVSIPNTFFADVSAGNVGIGTDNPLAKLHVNGTVRFSDATFLDCNGVKVLETDADGDLVCGNDDTGVSGDTDWTMAAGKMYPGTITDNVGIGTTNTTGARFAVDANGGLLNDFIVESDGDVSIPNTFFADVANKRVGIGTAVPTATLHVNGDIFVSGSYTGGSCDISERYQAIKEEADGLEPGDIVALDPDNELKIRKTDKAYSTMAMGVYSTKPQMVMGNTEEAKDRNDPPVALIGRIPTKVTCENGPIAVGDTIVSASKPGYGMGCRIKELDLSMSEPEWRKTTINNDKCRGAHIGIALQALESGEGVIEVLLKTGN